MSYITRVIALVVLPDGKPVFSEIATKVSIVDEAAGEFVEVEQQGRSDIAKIAIDTKEWPALRAAINRMVRECKP